MKTPSRRDRLAGLLLGTAVGDAIGLPREGLSARRAARLFGGAPLSHRLVFGHGMLSDDTEHACMTAQALLASAGDPRRFARSLAWRLRWWFAALPAGVGLATAKSILKLWIGFPTHRSGVYSAGNGPAMRAPIIGAMAADIDQLKVLATASTRLTHTHPDAEAGALVIALAAHCSMRGELDAVSFLAIARPHLAGTTMLNLIEQAADLANREMSMAAYLAQMGLHRGIIGYINHTVPAAIFCWLRWPGDVRTAVEQVILAGGDTDSTAAIVGALTGVSAGREAIPPDWLAGLVDFPRTTGWLMKLAARLAADQPVGPLPLCWPLVLVRNPLFLVVVLFHGFRRLLPPY